MPMSPTENGPEPIRATPTPQDGIDRFAWDDHSLQPGIGLALSGGGFRAMLFHAGALLRLNELGLLSRLDRISSVSGGSLAAGLLATRWPALGIPNAEGVFPDFRAQVVEPLGAFARSVIDLKAGLRGLFLPGTSVALEVAKSYRALVGDATLQDLPDRPQFVLCATNLQTGVLWRFSKPYAGDYLTGRLREPNIPLATAMAASSAFPPFLSPLKLDVPPEAFVGWPGRDGKRATPPDARSRGPIRLTDGGVYDNHGIEPLLKRFMTAFVSDGGAPFARVSAGLPDWFSQLRRVLDVTDNQVRSLRRRDLIARFAAGAAAVADGSLTATGTLPFARLGAYWGIGTVPQSSPPPRSLACDPDLVRMLASVETRLAPPKAGVPERLVNWGYAVSDLCIRSHYRGSAALADTTPSWPYPCFSLEGAAQRPVVS